MGKRKRNEEAAPEVDPDVSDDGLDHSDVEEAVAAGMFLATLFTTQQQPPPCLGLEAEGRFSTLSITAAATAAHSLGFQAASFLKAAYRLI